MLFSEEEGKLPSLYCWIMKSEGYMFLKVFIFLLQKNLDFKLRIIGGDISSIPGVSVAIEVSQT